MNLCRIPAKAKLHCTDETGMAIRRAGFDWNDIPILVALAHSGSMRTAGRQLGLTTSTVSRRLVAAEKTLQTRLFVRGPNGYKPTEAGQTFLGEAEQIEGSVHALLSNTNRESEAIRGSVRITSVDVMLEHWLIPRLPDLRQTHPELEIRLIPDDHVLSFNRGESDLAIRVVKPKEDAGILMRRIGTVGIAVYAAPGFKRGSRPRWGDLPWLSFDQNLAHAPEVAWLASNAPNAEPKVRTSSMAALISAAKSGLGAALLPCFATADSGLVMLSSGPVVQRDIFLLTHRQAGKIRRFRAVSEWIARMAQDDVALLRGK